MIIYTNSFDFNRINFDDLQINPVNSVDDTYVYTNNGIYKKIKRHFYKINMDQIKCENVQFKHIKLLVKSDDDSEHIEKHNSLSCLPFDCHVVQCKKDIVEINENIDFVREMHNQNIVHFYFNIKNSNNDYEYIMTEIGLFLEKNMSTN